MTASKTRKPTPLPRRGGGMSRAARGATTDMLRRRELRHARSKAAFLKRYADASTPKEQLAAAMDYYRSAVAAADPQLAARSVVEVIDLLIRRADALFTGNARRRRKRRDRQGEEVAA